MNVKHIAATLAILGSASFTLTGCKKDATEVPADGAAKPEGSCGAEKNGSCGAKKTDAPGGDAPADAPGGDPPAGDAAPAEAPAP